MQLEPTSPLDSIVESRILGVLVTSSADSPLSAACFPLLIPKFPLPGSVPSAILQVGVSRLPCRLRSFFHAASHSMSSTIAQNRKQFRFSHGRSGNHMQPVFATLRLFVDFFATCDVGGAPVPALVFEPGRGTG